MWREVLYATGGTVIKENSMEMPQKIKKKELPYDPAIPLLGVYSNAMKPVDQKRYLHFHVHCSIIHDSQAMEAN